MISKKKSVIAAIAVLVIVANIIGCDQTDTPPPPQPDIPRYTADRIIYIANAYSPTCWNKQSVPKWSVEYLGLGVWAVSKRCVLKSGFEPLPSLDREKYYFYESTGKLIKR